MRSLLEPLEPNISQPRRSSRPILFHRFVERNRRLRSLLCREVAGLPHRPNSSDGTTTWGIVRVNTSTTTIDVQAFETPIDTLTLGSTTFVYSGLMGPMANCTHTVIPAKSPTIEIGAAGPTTVVMGENPDREDERYAMRTGLCRLGVR